MRSLLVLSGWPEARVPTAAWWSTDAEGRPFALAHGSDGAEPAPVATNETRTVHAVLSGDLYNHRELRATLGGRHAVSSADDAEIVVHLYEERGLQCVNALRGAFALALWDARRRRLLLARDQLGLVPLYYAAERDRLAAASRLPMLTALPGIGAAWDAAALDTFLALGVIPPPATLHPAVRQLGPGELLVWEDGRARTQRYWRLTFPERRLASADLPGLIRTQMLEALRLRQPAAASGLLLSGGLDAAAVLALAEVDRTPPARAWTISPGGEADDDARAAVRLAAKLGVEHELLCTSADWPVAVDELLAAQGGPAGGPGIALLRAAARDVAPAGGVLLAGVGGEAVFGGSAPVRAAERARAYPRLPSLVREATEMWARLAPGGWAASARRLVHDVRLAPLEMYARAVSLFLPEERADLYTPESLGALGDARPWEALTALFAEAVSAGATDTADAIHYVELALRLPAESVALGGPGPDVRLPLADHRLAQFVASATPAQRGTARERQLLLRAAIAELVPGTTLRRGHRSPNASAAAGAGLRAFIEETLAPDRLAAQGLFRPETVLRLRLEHATGRRDHGTRLWALALATRWLERLGGSTAAHGAPPIHAASLGA